MNYVKLNESIIGKKSALTIYTNKSQILVLEGTTITKNILRHLKNYGYKSIYVENIIKDKCNYLLNPSMRINLLSKYSITLDLMNKKFNTYKSLNFKKAFEIDEIVESNFNAIVNTIIENINKNVLIDVVNIKSNREYRYEHSLNVALLSIYLGIKMNLKKNKLVKLGKASLLSDFGFSIIKENKLCNSNKKLTAKEKKKLEIHSKIAYDFLHDNTNFTITEILPVFQHHERIDGSGYPEGITGETMHYFSKIIAIADVFDALSSDRPFRPSMNLNDIIKYFKEKSGILFDEEICQILIANVVPYPKGTKVELSNNEIGFIAKYNPNNLDSPIVIIPGKQGPQIRNLLFENLEITNIIRKSTPTK